MINIKGYKINKLGTWWTKSYLLSMLICIVILSINHGLGKVISSITLIFLIWGKSCLISSIIE